MRLVSPQLYIAGLFILTFAHSHFSHFLTCSNSLINQFPNSLIPSTTFSSPSLPALRSPQGEEGSLPKQSNGTEAEK
jgi:hypothetical protein